MTTIVFASTQSEIQRRLHDIEKAITQGRSAQVAATAHALVEQAEQAGAKRLFSDALQTLGRIEIHLGNHQRAQELFETVIDLPSTAYATRKQATINLALAYHLRQDQHTALRILLDLKANLSAKNDKVFYVFTLNLLGIIASEHWHFDEARSHFQAAFDAALDLEDYTRLAYLKMALGNVARYQEAYQTSHDHYHEALALCPADCSPELLALLYWQQAATTSGMGRYQTARSYIDLGCEIISAYELPFLEVHFLVEQARLCFKQNHGDNAHHYFHATSLLEQAYQIAQHLGNIDLLARVLYSWLVIVFFRHGDCLDKQSEFSKISLLKQAFPGDIIENAESRTFTNLAIYRAQTYFWNGKNQTYPLINTEVEIRKIASAISTTMFTWLTYENIAPPNRYSVMR